MNDLTRKRIWTENCTEAHATAKEAEECDTGDIPQDKLVEDTDTIDYDVVNLFLREIAYKIVVDSFITGSMSETNFFNLLNICFFIFF